ncbi:MAG: hypothetical protein JWR26_2561 [Pedosphaera sp.]|nr:hypothetical protein [Pedosphaera sp.]
MPAGFDNTIWVLMLKVIGENVKFLMTKTILSKLFLQLTSQSIQRLDIKRRVLWIIKTFRVAANNRYHGIRQYQRLQTLVKAKARGG